MKRNFAPSCLEMEEIWGAVIHHKSSLRTARDQVRLVGCTGKGQVFYLPKKTAQKPVLSSEALIPQHAASW